MKGNQRLNFDYKIIRYSIQVDLQAHNLKIKKKKNQAILKFYFYFYETNGHEKTM